MAQIDPASAVEQPAWGMEEHSVSPLATLREVVEELAYLDRRAGTAAERMAAEWLHERLERAGAQVKLEQEQFRSGYARELLPLSLVGALAGLASTRGSSAAARMRWAALAAFASASIVDDVSNGLRFWRRMTARKLPTWNVVAEACGHEGQPTLVILAHHDAAPTGLIFDQRLQRRIAHSFPKLVESIDTSLPMWWPIAGAPALSALAAATGGRRLAQASTVACLVVSALGLDIARSPVSPGANDNLSGVAALVALAERFRLRPPTGMRVLLVSCGAEEVLQGGIYGFAERHFPTLDRRHTWFVNLDTIGSPRLVMVEGEGCFRMEDYPGEPLHDLMATVAEREEINLIRGVRARSSTDAVIPARHGYPTATLVSFDEQRCMSNYHQMSDTPGNLNYRTVASAVRLVAATADALADSLPAPGAAEGQWGEAPSAPAGLLKRRFKR